MLKAIMKGGGSKNEDFKFPLRATKAALEAKLLEIRHMSYDAQYETMLDNGLDVRSIMTDAKDEYRKLYNANEWAPAAHASDSKAVSKHFGRVNKVKSEVNSLVQNSNNSNKDKSSRNGRGKAKQFNFTYYSDRCTFCAQCVHSCRAGSLEMLSDEWELADFSLDSFCFDWHSPEPEPVEETA